MLWGRVAHCAEGSCGIQGTDPRVDSQDRGKSLPQVVEELDPYPQSASVGYSTTWKRALRRAEGRGGIPVGVEGGSGLNMSDENIRTRLSVMEQNGAKGSTTVLRLIPSVVQRGLLITPVTCR